MKTKKLDCENCLNKLGEKCPKTKCGDIEVLVCAYNEIGVNNE